MPYWKVPFVGPAWMWLALGCAGAVSVDPSGTGGVGTGGQGDFGTGGVAVASLAGFGLWIVNFFILAGIFGWSWFPDGQNIAVQFVAHTIMFGTVLGLVIDRLAFRGSR